MLKDVTPLPGNGTARSALVRFLERKLGGRMFLDLDRVPYGKLTLTDLWALAKTLQDAGVIRGIQPISGMSDEPRLISWSVEHGTRRNERSGGLSAVDERAALTSALAEALERYLWSEAQDYFRSPITKAPTRIAGHQISPARFVGFTPAMRSQHTKLQMHDDSQYLWIRGHSLVQDTDVFLPAQTVSAAHTKHSTEPVIRTSSTTGLATWTTKGGAILRGALEIIERDAYMIMWLNQLALPRLPWSDIRRYNSSLDLLLRRCAQYRLAPYLVRLITDAPTHAVAVVVVDEASPIHITIGTKAGRSLAHAAESALLEALRARRAARVRRTMMKGSTELKPVDVGHTDRLDYWARPENSPRLQFLYDGPLENVIPHAWEQDSDSEHLSRIVAWCKAKGYELASVDLGRSKMNPTNWKVEMVVMPEMQPMHLREKYQYTDGSRLTEIPAAFGYPPRMTPFIDEPHPFV